MKLRTFAICAVAAGASTAFLPAISFAACDARSGPNTAALVELYTSEGCSSCPPADQQLSRLRQALDPAAEAVPLALHVGYWDYIGWKDPYAQAAFGERQNWLVRANQRKTVYTPQFFVGGAELRAWRGGFRDKVRQLNAVPAAAAIRVRASIAPGGALALDAEATTRAGAEPAALYLALAESGLVSKVTRGENSGVTLAHDHVVRAWIGPIRLTGGAARVQRDIALPAAWNRAGLEVVAFVQDERDGSVLQAVSASQCAAS
ncbi:MAG: DUF1223 domain-containing protein [Betaproteobacteria bacterium]|nr:DUF1223 domain-containing protein [Betaproteobacteria bacterium]